MISCMKRCFSVIVCLFDVFSYEVDNHCLFALVEKEFEDDGSNDTHDVRFAKWLLKDKVVICSFFAKRFLVYIYFIPQPFLFHSLFSIRTHS